MAEMFTTGEIAQDLIFWAENLNCLGGVLTALKESSDEMNLIWFGDGIGRIIQDYASAMGVVLNSANYAALNTVLTTQKPTELSNESMKKQSEKLKASA
jgi:hypothetical protein